MDGYTAQIAVGWNHRLVVDIHTNNEEAFRTSCYFGRFKIIKFLITIYKQENNTSYIEILNKYPNIRLKNE